MKTVRFFQQIREVLIIILATVVVGILVYSLCREDAEKMASR